MKCTGCRSELPAGAQFCPSCGTRVGTEKQTFQVSAENLVGKVKEILRDASVKRVVVKDEKGNVVMSIPATAAAAGALATVALAPWLAALGVIAAVVTKRTLEVERIPSDISR